MIVKCLTCPRKWLQRLRGSDQDQATSLASQAAENIWCPLNVRWLEALPDAWYDDPCCFLQLASLWVHSLGSQMGAYWQIFFKNQIPTVTIWYDLCHDPLCPRFSTSEDSIFGVERSHATPAWWNRALGQARESCSVSTELLRKGWSFAVSASVLWATAPRTLPVFSIEDRGEKRCRLSNASVRPLSVEVQTSEVCATWNTPWNMPIVPWPVRCLRLASDKEPKNWWQLWAGCEVMDQWCLQTLVFWPSGVMFPVVLRIAQKLVLCHSLSLCIERDVTGLLMGHGSCEFCRSWEKVGHFRVCGTGVAKAWTFPPCPRPP